MFAWVLATRLNVAMICSTRWREMIAFKSRLDIFMFSIEPYGTFLFAKITCSAATGANELSLSASLKLTGAAWRFSDYDYMITNLNSFVLWVCFCMRNKIKLFPGLIFISHGTTLIPALICTLFNSFAIPPFQCYIPDVQHMWLQACKVIYSRYRSEITA